MGEKGYEEGRFCVACRLTAFGFAVSLLGWCFEVVGRYAIYGVLADRGFVTLPLCPIYGITLVAIYLIFGTPRRMRGLLSLLSGGRVWVRYAVYFAAVTVFSTAVELVTALAFAPFGVRLWTYAEQPFNLLGVVCLGYSLLWGVLITVFMGLLWERSYGLVKKIPPRVIMPVGVTLGAAVSVDFLINCVLTVMGIVA